MFKQVAPLGIVAASSFGLGYFSPETVPKDAPICLDSAYQEISIVELKELAGDLLKVNVSGPVRLVWNDDFTEGDGVHEVALGQLPYEGDRDFRNFKYVGNAGTYKFYPSDTYAARGTHPSKRRFFASRLEAEAAGFVASKLVK